MSAVYHAGLDVGASSVKCVVAVEGENGRPVYSGIGVAQCRNSVQDGILVDMEGAVHAAARAMDEAEELCGFRIERVLLGVGGAHVRGMVSTGTVASGTVEEPGVVTEKDIAAALESAGAIDLPPGSVPLERMILDYAFDGFSRLKKPPIGLQASSVTARVFTVYSDRIPAENMAALVENAGRKVDGLMPAILAAGTAVLTRDEMELGAVLVDVGSSTTGIAVFQGGGPVHLAAFPMASDHITRDLQRLRLSWVQAEKLKVETTSPTDRLGNPNMVMNIPRVGDRGTLQIAHPLVAQVISQRAEAICEAVALEIRRCGLEPGDLSAGLIITGGGARTRGLADTAAAITGLPAEIGYPRAADAPSELLCTPEFSVAAGLAAMGFTRAGRKGRGAFTGPGKGMLKRVRSFLDTLR